MGNLRKLIQKGGSNKKTVTCTVKMPEDASLFVDNLRDHLNMPKHVVLLELIEEGIKVAKAELELIKKK